MSIGLVCFSINVVEDGRKILILSVLVLIFALFGEKSTFFLL